MTRAQEGWGPIFGPPVTDDPGRHSAAGLLEVPWRTRIEGGWLLYERGDRERFERELWTPKLDREGMNAKATRERGMWHYKVPSGQLLPRFIEIAESGSLNLAA